MRTFTCAGCGQLLFFENSACLRCGRPLGFEPERWELATFEPSDTGRLSPLDGGPDQVRCANATVAKCNWMVPADGGDGADDGLCPACRLTRCRPNDFDTDALAAFADAEGAKRRLLYQLHDLGLPVVTRQDDPDRGLAFDLLSSAIEPVTTGHDDGVITLDLAESDDAHRTQVQQSLGEPYRTLLGHFRHEIGHYYWSVLVEPDPDRVALSRATFGDDRADYQAAIDHHYQAGPPPGWEDGYVSSYATMHPYEDWAETFAHYLHIRDTLQTAAAFGVFVAGPSTDTGEPDVGAVDPDLVAVPAEAADPDGIEAVLDQWLPLTYALNAVNRSMGKEDLYPFVLAPAVVHKLAVVHAIVTA